MKPDMLLVVAVILLATRLPSFMNRLGMPNADKTAFVIMVFLLLGLAWLVVQGIGLFI